MTNDTCSDCGRDHSNQITDYPVGAIVEAIVAVYGYGAGRIGRLSIGSHGKVYNHTEDGRAVIEMTDGETGKKSTHTFHQPETYVKVSRLPKSDPSLSLDRVWNDQRLWRELAPVQRAKYKKLEAFTREILALLRDGSIDGEDVQAIALRHEVLKPETVYKSCGEHCQCAMVYDEIEKGVTCYKLNL